MNFLFVINTKKYPYHKEYYCLFSEALSQYANISMIDMAEPRLLHEIFYEISKKQGDLAITFDCAGFELKTELDELSFNRLKCRVAHMIFEKPYKLENNLCMEMNLSHFVFLPLEIKVDEFIKSHKNIPNVDVMPLMDCESISKWFEEARKEFEI